MEDPHSRRLLSVPSRADAELEKHQPIRIFLNYDAVGHSTDRDCHSLHDVVKLGEPAPSAIPSYHQYFVISCTGEQTNQTILNNDDQ